MPSACGEYPLKPQSVRRAWIHRPDEIHVVVDTDLQGESEDGRNPLLVDIEVDDLGGRWLVGARYDDADQRIMLDEVAAGVDRGSDLDLEKLETVKAVRILPG